MFHKNSIYTHTHTHTYKRVRYLSSKSLLRRAQWEELLNYCVSRQRRFNEGGKRRASETHNFTKDGANSGASITLVPGMASPLGLPVNFVADKAAALRSASGVSIGLEVV